MVELVEEITVPAFALSCAVPSNNTLEPLYIPCKLALKNIKFLDIAFKIDDVSDF